MDLKEHELGKLTFAKGAEVAFVVYDGLNTRSYTLTECRRHKTLRAAISYLEMAGYGIVTDIFL